ncbi:MAG: DUF1428 domain-containing protein [Alphaproteobacteria bacterium]|mgnify:CR=1 FL=1|nr:DUF1428 domain-containing protein [Alphaproteobacteria bacterium]
MYIAGFVIPVPAEKMEAYRAWAESSAAFFKEYGCLEIVEAWEDNVPSGQYTDFRRAVDARDGEKIVFAWQIWPSRAALDAAEEKMHQDPRMEISGEIPFDPKRLILGCFTPIHVTGRA